MEIADWFGVTEGTIRAHAKKLGWTRLKAVGAARPDRPALSSQLPVLVPPTTEVPDTKVIVGKGHDLVLRMLDELNAVTTNQGQLEDMIYEDTEGDRDGRRRASMLNAISLPSRAMTIKALATAAKTLAETLPKVPSASAGQTASAEPEPDSWASLLQ